MAFDPNNPTFYGECLPVALGRDVTGTAIAAKYTGPDGRGRAVTYLYDDDFTQTADAGDSILFGVDPQSAYLQRDSEAVFTAVVELAAGSSGTFRLAAGADPAYELTSAALCTEGLGTFTATGAQRVLAPIRTSYTVPMIFDESAQPLLFLEVLSGTVVIRQIRVRMWPPGGAGGAWVAEPDYVYDFPPDFMKSAAKMIVSTAAEPPETLGSIGSEAHVAGPGKYGGWDVFDDPNPPFRDMTRAVGGAHPLRYHAFAWNPHNPDYDLEAAGRFHFDYVLREGSPGHDWFGRYEMNMVVLAFVPRRVTSRPSGGPGFADPDRIPWEGAATVRDGSTGGVLMSDFGGWSVPPRISGGSGNDGVILTRVFEIASSPWDATSEINSDGIRWLYAYSEAGIESREVGWAPQEGDYPLPDSPIVGIEVAPDFIAHPPDRVDGIIFQGVGGSTADGYRAVKCAPTRARHVLDRIEWFNPALPPPMSTRPPRFYVTYTEVDEDPRDVSHVVGIGKPADDLSIFRVPTPLGTLRELRHGEQVSDVSVAYPLKVKLEDGSWTVVAGMTPDD